MPRMTTKYRAALKIAKAISIPNALEDQSALYQKLNEHNYFWNSKLKTWGKKPALAPTDLVRIRVWAAAEHVEQAADDAMNALSHHHYKLLERSSPYPCRPPKQLESRIYLTFLPEKNDAA